MLISAEMYNYLCSNVKCSVSYIPNQWKAEKMIGREDIFNLSNNRGFLLNF